MIQRFIYQCMAAGVAAIKSDNTILQSLFGDLWQLSATEVGIITDWFNASTFTVSHAYKLPQARYPQYIIVTTTEQQPLFALSDYGGGVAGTTPAGTIGQVASTYSSMWQHNIQIVGQAAKNPELAFYMFEIARYIMTAAKPALQGFRIDLPAMSGSEMSQAPGTTDTGDFIFQRALMFRGQREFKVIDKTSTLGRVFTVKGIERPTAMAESDELQLVTTTV